MHILSPPLTAGTILPARRPGVRGNCSNRSSIRRGDVERWVLEALQHQLMAPDLVEEFVRAFNEEVNASRREHDARRESLAREQKEVKRQIDNLLDAVASGALRGQSLQGRLEALEGRQEKIAVERAGLSDEPVRLHPNLARLYREKVAALHSLLNDKTTRTEAVEIIRSLIDRIVLWPAETGGLEIELVGDLAGMEKVAGAKDAPAARLSAQLSFVR